VLDQTGNVIGVAFASIESGQNLNFAIPCDYLAALQGKKTELRPFSSAVPRAKRRSTLLDRIGNERPLAGVVGEALTYDTPAVLQWGQFSFSLRNKLNRDVAGISGIIVFYDVNGQPIDIYPIKYQGVLPAGLAKRIQGQVDQSVERLNCPERGFVEAPRTPKGKVEFRILDFTVE
jgi:hypothetical protein